MRIASIDIGSTWTKAALFRPGRKRLEVEARTAVPTTTANLADGFFEVLEALIGSRDCLREIHSGEVALRYSSSAKGGLGVAAIGLVPALTVEAATLAAQSAGAKLTHVLPYIVTRDDLAKLEESPPDIVLLTGGTDGGDGRHVVQNARVLAGSRLNCPIVYAGNRGVRDEVEDILRDRHLVLTDNVMPIINQLSVEGARQAIADIFLSIIVDGKGLRTIVDRTGVEPRPTPLSVLEFVGAIRKSVPDWTDFALVDIGGATTDLYSAATHCTPPDVVRRGLPEPEIKRSVEGDLGMRSSAQSTWLAGEQVLSEIPARLREAGSAVPEYLSRVSNWPSTVAKASPEKDVDCALAEICFALAIRRHAGRVSEVFTPDGEVCVHIGKDLTQAPKIIGSGGWLSRDAGFNPGLLSEALSVDERGRRVLAPREFEYYRDSEYLFPLLANAASLFPDHAARTGIGSLVRQG